MLVKDVSKEYQGQGAGYETHRSVREVREDCRISRNAEIDALLRHLQSIKVKALVMRHTGAYFRYVRIVE